MIVVWEVEDGYAGPSAPHETEIDDDELAECETEEERRDLIRSAVQNDFENTITWYITDEMES